MLRKIDFSRICKHSQNVLDYIYGSLNISRIKLSLITPKTTKSVKNFPLKILRLYTVCNDLIKCSVDQIRDLVIYKNLLPNIYFSTCSLQST